MKKQTFKAGFVRIGFTAILTSALLIGNYQPAYAFSDSTELSLNKLNVKYMGMKNNLLIFEIKFNNPEKQISTLELTDRDNQVLFRSDFAEKAFSKTIYIDKGPENCMVTFLVKTETGDFKQSFELNTTTKTVYELMVTKL